MDDARQPGERDSASTRAGSPLRRWSVGVLIALVVLALAVFVPGPLFRASHSKAARQLVDEAATGRAALLARQDEFRSPLSSLGSPVRSWTEVACRLSPRYSDGDGEQDVVMFYWQQCALEAYEVYALPRDAGSAAEVAEGLGGHTTGKPTCSEILFDVLSPDYGASAPDEYSTALWWLEPGGDAPADQPDRCTMPTPGGADAAHVTRDIEKSTNADAYVIYRVGAPVGSVDVGCKHGWPWIISCAGEPQGFPAL